MLYRGKAFCRLYQQEQKHLQEISSTLSKKESYVRQRSIYKKAGEAINNLGSLLDINRTLFLDDEMLMCLDVSMIDVACQVNNLKEYSRCLLCLNKAKLHKSHLCPDSILNAFASGLGKTKNKRIFNLTFFEVGKMTSPHGVTMWLFCEKCENFYPEMVRHTLFRSFLSTFIIPIALTNPKMKSLSLMTIGCIGLLLVFSSVD
jgi:hypothetical protein